jgi:hypothetical protein
LSQNGPRLFRYNDPELDLTASLKIYPSISDFGRVRIEFDTRIRYEIFKDFYWGLGVFDNFDNGPPIETDSVKNDLGIDATIRWKFKRKVKDSATIE